MKINNNTIIKESDSKIREFSFLVGLPLSKTDVQIMQDMLDYVRRSQNSEIAEKECLRPSVGISAIQIGFQKKMCVIICDDVDKNGNPIHFEYALANPEILSRSVQMAYLTNGEGCLSVTNDQEGLVHRHARIKVKAYDFLQNKEITIRAHGYLAIVLQHEFDHFEGKLYFDHIDKENPLEPLPNSLAI